MDPLQVVFQFLKEECYTETFEALKRESGKDYIEGQFREHLLRQTFGEMQITGQTTTLRELLKGKMVELLDERKKLTLDASPVSLVKIGESILVAFNDKSIRLFDESLNLIKSEKLDVPTILSMQYSDGKVYFGTMGGEVGVIDLETLKVTDTKHVQNHHITNVRICGDYLVCTSYSGALAYIKYREMEVEVVYEHEHGISAMCLVNDGVIYSVQNDNVFRFRSAKNHKDVKYLLMNPTEFDVCGFEVRDMKESPSDPSTFVALTDQNRAVVYKYTPNAKDVEILANVSHITSDGLTQPQIIWPTGPVIISTTDDMKVVAVNISTNTAVFELSEWRKAARCVLVSGEKLYVGAFDKTLSQFTLNYSENL